MILLKFAFMIKLNLTASHNDRLKPVLLGLLQGGLTPDNFVDHALAVGSIDFGLVLLCNARIHCKLCSWHSHMIFSSEVI